MIHFNPEQRLNLILAQTNTALAKAIEYATPEQHALLNASKDLPSLLTSLTNRTLGQDTSGQVILDILKHHPAFKELGQFQTEVKALLQTLSKDPKLHPLTTKLDALLLPLPTPNSGDALQGRIADSGVFLESKLARAAHPASEIKPLLQQLSTLLQGSDLPRAKKVDQHLHTLLNHSILQHTGTYDTPDAQRLATIIDKILSPLHTALEQSDTLYTPQTRSLLERLRQSIEPMLPPTSHTLATTPPSDSALTSPTPTVSLSSQASTPPQHPTPSATLSQVQEILETLHTKLLQSHLGDSRSLLQSLETLVIRLHDTPITTPETAKQMTGEIQNLLSRFQSIIDTADPLFSQEMRPLLQELKSLSLPERLMGQLPIDTLSKDTKALLLQIQQEVQQASSPFSQEALKQVDRLVMQIDYYQLYSHLSHNATLYLPYAWNFLEGGTIAFSHQQEQCFYCRIDLTLQHYGALDLMLSLSDDQRIDIRGHTQKPELRDLIKTQLPLLRSALRDVGLQVGHINIDLASTGQEGYEEGPHPFDAGFEVKI